jgi:uncharacterized protein
MTPPASSPVAMVKTFADVASTDAAVGSFTARVAVFDVVDRAGDRIRPGAFTESLATWRRSGKTLPVVWSHAHHDVKAILGKVVDAHEDAHGLVVDGLLELAYPEATRVYDLLKSGTIGDWSFAFVVTKSQRAEVDGQPVRDILAAHLLEVGPCLIGMNPATATLALKSAADLGYPFEAPDPRIVRYRRRCAYWTTVLGAEEEVSA